MSLDSLSDDDCTISPLVNQCNQLLEFQHLKQAKAMEKLTTPDFSQGERLKTKLKDLEKTVRTI